MDSERGCIKSTWTLQFVPQKMLHDPPKKHGISSYILQFSNHFPWYVHGSTPGTLGSVGLSSFHWAGGHLGTSFHPFNPY